MVEHKLWAGVAVGLSFCLLVGPGLAGASDRRGPQEIGRGVEWIEQEKLVPDDAYNQNAFGTSVAVHGATLVVGSPYDDAVGTNSGSAYVYERVGRDWFRQAKLLASDGGGGNWFGTSVALDGNTLIVGAPRGLDATCSCGSAYVFTRDGTAWTEQVELNPESGHLFRLFGWSASISGDTAIIGAPGIWPNNTTGAAYVFVRRGAVWEKQAELVPGDGANGDRFGTSVSICGDTLAVGASQLGSGPGRAYVYRRRGADWEKEARLVGDEVGSFDSFGTSVSVAGDRVVIGAPDVSGGSGPGSAYVFTRSGRDWSLEAELLVADPLLGEVFGQSVTIEGETICVGAYMAWAKAGSAYVFSRQNGAWAQSERLFPSAGWPYDVFGWSISMSGRTVAVGALNDSEGARWAGAAYVYVPVD